MRTLFHCRGAVKSAASSPATASTDDSLLGYAKDQDLVALNTTPTQASLDKVMTGKGRRRNASGSWSCRRDQRGQFRGHCYDFLYAILP
ncbi:hypothetical protein MRX96_046503 [Rhipicephalus microplus]